MINLHNTATKKKEELDTSKKVLVYTCGPTVYLDPHIGNWRTFIFYDTLIRVLKANSIDVKHVINITDVGHLVSDADDGDDKLVAQAEKERKTAWEIAEEYTNKYLEGRQALNMLEPDVMPKATETIEEQISFVKTLDDKGYTYKIDDGVYFDTSKLDDYGKLANLNIDGQEEGARVEINQQKKNPSDFALWKFSPKNLSRDMEWDSPWGKGFPGWHLECSVMAKEYLADTIDIHAGGVDHIPIHHTNEIAQSEAANDAPFSKVWLHGEFMMVDGAKMAKSQNNFYTLEDISEKGYSAMDFRLLVLQGHYRTETNFSWENLDAAAMRLKDINNFAALKFQSLSDVEDSIDILDTARLSILEKLNNDLNTPQALAELSNVIQKVTNTGLSEKSVESMSMFLEFIDNVFGLKTSEVEDISDEQKELIAERNNARDKKDFEESDRIRDELQKTGIEINDLADKTIWRRIKLYN